MIGYSMFSFSSVAEIDILVAHTIERHKFAGEFSELRKAMLADAMHEKLWYPGCSSSLIVMLKSIS